jgi:hypothetical protein
MSRQEQTPDIWVLSSKKDRTQCNVKLESFYLEEAKARYRHRLRFEQNGSKVI